MQLGTVIGKTTTRSFSFEAESRVRKTDYLSVKDPEGSWVLTSVDNITTDGVKTKAEAKVIGYRDNRGFLKTPKIPFSPGAPVFHADSDFIRETLGLKDSGVYVGLLEGYNLKVKIPIEHLIKKHISVLAKTGAGKSYLTGVIMEELAEHRIPVVLIDPHGSISHSNQQIRNPLKRGSCQCLMWSRNPTKAACRFSGSGQEGR